MLIVGKDRKGKQFLARGIDLGVSDDGKTYRCKIITKRKTIIAEAPKLDDDLLVLSKASATEIRLAHDIAALGSLGADVTRLEYHSDLDCEGLFGVRIETLLPDTPHASR